ncbi:ribose ABC transporter substrate-binding protein [Agromyces tardus]|jgi:ribose transport system substrate-binding protein|uniref:Ribose ABC transporter substrate-binding protein n=1 Tax=Agromyces tardus TaxID=2583849 RepID=A0A3M8A370_9MICO|nr:substrate-binding domain-containing protein [Agromyces tardus]RNB45689.1 ribose ABC transporter substrate-binding protein [Agromyces tardus]
MIRHSTLASAAVAAGLAAMVLSGCSTGSGDAPAKTGSVEGAPDWCGPNEATLGLLDGFGGNSWRLVTTAAGADEVAKCPSITDYLYADGQGDTQKAISDIQGMVAKGVDAMVVFPDAGEAMLPALRSAHDAGVITVPYRVNPGGEDGKDYDIWVGADFVADGVAWGNWIKTNFPDGANILFLSGPAGNSQGEDERKGFESVLTDPSYVYLGEQPFEVTNWDPATTQQVLTAAIAKYDKIDVIVSDFGPSLVGALPEFQKSGRSIPALVTSDGNVLGCFFEDNKDANPDFKLMTVATGNDNVRLAVQHAVARATGGVIPEATAFEAPVFEDSVSGTPNPVQCRSDLPGDIYLSAEMSAEDQAALLK